MCDRNTQGSDRNTLSARLAGPAGRGGGPAPGPDPECLSTHTIGPGPSAPQGCLRENRGGLGLWEYARAASASFQHTYTNYVKGKSCSAVRRLPLPARFWAGFGGPPLGLAWRGVGTRGRKGGGRLNSADVQFALASDEVMREARKYIRGRRSCR